MTLSLQFPFQFFNRVNRFINYHYCFTICTIVSCCFSFDAFVSSFSHLIGISRFEYIKPQPNTTTTISWHIQLKRITFFQFVVALWWCVGGWRSFLISNSALSISLVFFRTKILLSFSQYFLTTRSILLEY